MFGLAVASTGNEGATNPASYVLLAIALFSFVQLLVWHGVREALFIRLRRRGVEAFFAKSGWPGYLDERFSAASAETQAELAPHYEFVNRSMPYTWGCAGALPFLAVVTSAVMNFVDNVLRKL